MSKRSFDDFATESPELRFRAASEHVDNLLKAAQTLKKDLERLAQHHNALSDETITSTLKQHNTQILSIAHSLSQDGEKPSKETGSSRKALKVEEHEGIVTGSASTVLPVVLTKWTPQDMPPGDTLPPLPPVTDPILEKAYRTQKAMAQGLGEMNYERLEWIGDAYLYLISSVFIYQTFPTLEPGKCSQLRERLVKNETLSMFTQKYGIDQRAELPAEFNPGGRSAGGTTATLKARQKVLGDLMESFIAAAILSDADGLSRVTAWLKIILSSVIKREILNEDKRGLTAHQHQIHTHIPSISVGSEGGEGGDSIAPAQAPIKAPLAPKVLLSQAIGTRGVTISYKDINEKKSKTNGQPWYTVGAYYDGLGETNLSLAFGSGPSKKEAGAAAALKALENKKLIKRLQDLKKKTNDLLAEAGNASAGSNSEDSCGLNASK
ncbi:ribonuclease III [Xylariaceae sp. FL0255]|nr:ribonuclease III [Xylariaceae sp. FL0255]